MEMQDAVGVLVGFDVRQEVVILDCDVFGARPKLRVPSQFQAAGVVLEALGVDAGLGEVKVYGVCFEFLEQV